MVKPGDPSDPLAGVRRVLAEIEAGNLEVDSPEAAQLAIYLAGALDGAEWSREAQQGNAQGKGHRDAKRR